MTALRPPHTHSKLKGCLAIIAFPIVFFATVPFIVIKGGELIQHLFPYDERHFKMVLADAQVTNITTSRQISSYYLDGSWLNSHYFGGYVRATAADRKRFAKNYGSNAAHLSEYLDLHDRLTKAANSPLLTVRRGSIITHWILYSATPESKVKVLVKERPFITHIE